MFDDFPVKTTTEIRGILRWPCLITKGYTSNTRNPKNKPEFVADESFFLRLCPGIGVLICIPPLLPTMHMLVLDGPGTRVLGMFGDKSCWSNHVLKCVPTFDQDLPERPWTTFGRLIWISHWIFGIWHLRAVWWHEDSNATCGNVQICASKLFAQKPTPRSSASSSATIGDHVVHGRHSANWRGGDGNFTHFSLNRWKRRKGFLPWESNIDYNQ